MKLDYSTIMPFMPAFLDGAWMTVKLSILSLAIGLLLGIAGGLCKVSESKLLRYMAFLYTWIFRGTPFWCSCLFYTSVFRSWGFS